MHQQADIVIVGTGSFAARILLDLAATQQDPLQVVVAGRRPERIAWLETAARARAHMFARPVQVTGANADPADGNAMAELLARLQPRAVLQAASLQTAAVILAQGNAWSRLVAQGGLSATAVLQAVISSRVAAACQQAAPKAAFVNACFPDVVNSLLAARGLPITCGNGNIQILAHAFAGHLAGAGARDMRLLAHYQNLASWRRGASERAGANARVWIDGAEVGDVFARFAGVSLTPEPVIDISGAAGVPLLVALARGTEWRGHAPGPAGLPGGYPVRVGPAGLALDLPDGVTRDAAIAWNEAHEAASGLVVDANGNARYTGRLRDELAAASPDLAGGFHARDLEPVQAAMRELRDRMLAQPG